MFTKFRFSLTAIPPNKVPAQWRRSMISKSDRKRPEASRDVDVQPGTEERAVGKRTLIEEVAARSPRRLVERASLRGSTTRKARKAKT